MKTILYTTAAALFAAATPASAQILGGGVGGGGSGILGGSTMSSMPSPMRMPMDTPTRTSGSSVRGDAMGSATGTATKSVNPRTGQVSTKGSAGGSAAGSLTQTRETQQASRASGLTGSGDVAGSGSADAQLLGTDAVRGSLQQSRDTAGNKVTTFRTKTGNYVTATRDRSGAMLTITRDKTGKLLSATKTGAGTLNESAQASATGSGKGSAMSSGTGSFSGMSQNLALAGSAAAEAMGSFDVQPGTQLYDLNGKRLGKVREVYADGSGRVKGLLVKVEGDTVLLEAHDFAANSQGLVTVLSEAQITAAGSGQADGAAAGSGAGPGASNAIFAGLSHNLALAGSAAAQSSGSLDIKSGTQLYDLSGEKIGKVKQVIADGQGRIKALLIKAEDSTATLSAANFAANGDVLVTAMSQTQIVSAGDKQAGTTDAPAQGISSNNNSQQPQTGDAVVPARSSTEPASRSGSGSGGQASGTSRSMSNQKGRVSNH